MPPIVVDTNIIRAVLDVRNARGETLRARIGTEGYALPTAVLYEVERGLLKEEREGRGNARRRDAIRRWMLGAAELLPLDATVAYVAAELWTSAKLARPARNITEIDLLVAATALAFGRRLATLDQGLIEALDALGHGDLLDESLR